MELVAIDCESDEQSKRQQHFLQSSFWAEFKTAHGWSALRFSCKHPVKFECSVLVRSFHIPIIGKFSVAYVPMGIDILDKSDIKRNTAQYVALLSDFSDSIRSFLEEKTLYIRYDVPIDCASLEERDEYTHGLIESGKLRKPFDNVQPPDTTVLDLSLDESQLLDGMKSKWRYNIRLAQKKGVVIRRGSSDDIDVFYELYRTTSERDGIAIHSKEYYRDLLFLGRGGDSSKDDSNPLVSLYIAYHEGQPLAAIITLFTPKQAVYLYGASSNEKRNLMATYLLQWVAICDAKTYGCGSYDFYGMPPTDDENHPMHGLYRFKTGFGGRIIHRPGSVDYPLSSLYTPYILAERLRNFWYKKIKKLMAGR